MGSSCPLFLGQIGIGMFLEGGIGMFFGGRKTGGTGEKPLGHG